MTVWKALCFSTLFAVASPLFAADPFVGTWILDLAHTSTTPANPTRPPNSGGSGSCRQHHWFLAVKLGIPTAERLFQFPV